MNAVIIGSGNVATIFAEKLFANGVDILQIVARNINTGKDLAERVKANYTQDYNQIVPDADIFFISVQDDFLPEVAAQLKNVLPKSAFVVHTTGSASIQVLTKVSSRYGVLYPLQSLRKENAIVQDIPLFLDASSEQDLETLQFFAQKISTKIASANDEQRIRLHIAAVFVSNFPNYLYMLADSFCEAHKIDFSFLLPLMEETVSRLHQFSPKSIQTGPAARGDKSTIEKHETFLLQDNSELLEVYRFMTERILEKFSK